MRTKYLTTVLAMLLLPMPVHAQQAFDPISVHPANVSHDQPFLILIEDAWADACGGSISVEVSSDSIEILGTLASPVLGRVCAAALMPFKELINPQDFASGPVDFADTIAINYRVDNGGGAQLRFSEQLSFGSDQNAAISLQSGGFITPGLERSGLFIDQQGSILSAALFDYGDDGQGSWYYSAGQVNGNVYSGELVSYGLIVCVTAPCSRTAPVAQGRINIVLRNANEAVVDFDGVDFPGSVFQGNDQTMVYRRLNFNRSASLPPEPGDGSAAVPDLVGRWAGGMIRNDLPLDDFRALVTEYAGSDFSHGVLGHRFNVFDAASLTLPTVPGPAFQIFCGDLSPVDGRVGCSLQGYRYGDGEGLHCEGSFDYAAVGVERLVADASCGEGNDAVTTRFELYRRN